MSMSVADLREAVKKTEINYSSATFLRRVLVDGWAVGLSSAFTWDNSPQGYDYWARRSADIGLLTSEDRAFLVALLLRANREFR